MSEANPAQLIGQPTAIRTFELTQYVTGYVEGTLADWNAQLQDQIFEALERLSHRIELPVAIVHAYCDIDYGHIDDKTGQMTPDRPFIRVIASEIVASYEPNPLNKAQQLYEMFKQGRTH